MVLNWQAKNKERSSKLDIFWDITYCTKKVNGGLTSRFLMNAQRKQHKWENNKKKHCNRGVLEGGLTPDIRHHRTETTTIREHEKGKENI